MSDVADVLRRAAELIERVGVAPSTLCLEPGHGVCVACAITQGADRLDEAHYAALDAAADARALAERDDHLTQAEVVAALRAAAERAG